MSERPIFVSDDVEMPEGYEPPRGRVWAIRIGSAAGHHRFDWPREGEETALDVAAELTARIKQNADELPDGIKRMVLRPPLEVVITEATR